MKREKNQIDIKAVRQTDNESDRVREGYKEKERERERERE